jgi:hypothetical protein
MVSLNFFWFSFKLILVLMFSVKTIGESSLVSSPVFS